MSLATVPNNKLPVVTLCRDLKAQDLENLFSPYHLQIIRIPAHAAIPGSHFGEPEAGLVSDVLNLRDDTPVHSALHEACHYICMEPRRRQHLHTDAGGDYDEENAVCYLSILLADNLPSYSASKMMLDMDEWGYTFRLGSARCWFEEDAEDAEQWLRTFGIIDGQSSVTGKLRSAI